MKRWLPLFFLPLVGSMALASSKPIDYQTLDFNVVLHSLRAGNHDASGTNQYFFQTKLYGFPILKEEVKKTFEEKKKNEADLGKFAEIKIDSLKYWTPEKKPTGTQISVPGDRLRSLIAEVMRNFNVPEDQTALKAEITMYEMNKKFGWIGSDIKVGTVNFDIIPDTLPRVAHTEDKVLTITDAQGTYVELNLHFKANEAVKAPEAKAP